MNENDVPGDQIPESKTLVKKKTRLSLVWIIPIVAAVIGAWVAMTSILNQGPTITITFRTAEGMEAGKTKIRYNGVDIGTVKSIRLTNDHRRVVATAAMAPKTEEFFVEDTKFWVVSPRVSGASVTGLGTLISGAYIGLEIGKSEKKQTEFKALIVPPVVTGDVPGRFFVLKTTDLGSLDYSSPIYFRRLKVGEVVSYELDKDGKTLTVKIFVKAPYDQYVTQETLFWQESGIDVSLSASGVSVQTESLMTLLIGGITFETPATAPALPPAMPNTQFNLYANRAEAYRPPFKNPQTFVLVFRQSVRGLSPGAPVDLRGIQIGRVDEIRAEADEKALDFIALVTISVDLQQLGIKVRGGSMGDGSHSAAHRQMVDALISRGFRAQLRTGSLLTGALYVAMDFFPDAPPFKIDWTQHPVRVATVPGSFEGIDATIASVIKKLDQVPYQEIGEDIRTSLTGVKQTLRRVDRTLTGFDQTLSGVDQELPNALSEVNEAARSLRSLADYLDRHPEALIKGKKPEKGE